MEVVEHVPDPLTYLSACHALLKPGGLHLCSTINRNSKSFAMAISARLASRRACLRTACDADAGAGHADRARARASVH